MPSGEKFHAFMRESHALEPNKAVSESSRESGYAFSN